MSTYNKVIVMGNITRDIELRQTPQGNAVCDIGLAMNRKYTKDNGEKVEEATFIDVAVWGRQAELADQYLSKGRSVLVEGRLKMDSWEDKNTGEKRNKLKVVAEKLQFVGGGGDAPQKEARENKPVAQERVAAMAEDNIPF